MGSGRTSRYADPGCKAPPVPPNAARLLAEALLGSELVTKGANLVVRLTIPTETVTSCGRC